MWFGRIIGVWNKKGFTLETEFNVKKVNFFIILIKDIFWKFEIFMFENFVFRRFLDEYGETEIKFWRTQKKQEVDFVIREKNAFEAEFAEDNQNASAYESFRTTYPNIPLTLIHFDNELEINKAR